MVIKRCEQRDSSKRQLLKYFFKTFFLVRIYREIFINFCIHFPTRFIKRNYFSPVSDYEVFFAVYLLGIFYSS